MAKKLNTTRPDLTTKSMEICPICEELIKESVGKKVGDDAIMCDGICSGWLHRRCAGLSKAAYIELSKSDDPFYCPQCRLNKQQLELDAMRKTVEELASKLTNVCNKLSNGTLSLEVSEKTNSPTYCDITRRARGNETNIRSPVHSIPDERKFNLVIYGQDECNETTKKSERARMDREAVVSILSKVDGQVNGNSVRDCFRLGKYVNGKRRPILTRLVRSCDVQSILSKRSRLKDLPSIRIKPDMSKQERKVESLLLKERRQLINSGQDRKSIKIRFNTIYVVVDMALWKIHNFICVQGQPMVLSQ